IVRAETPKMGPDIDDAPRGYHGEPTWVCADECERPFFTFLHVGDLANLLKLLPLRLVVPGTNLLRQGRAYGGAGPIRSVAIVAVEQLQSHRIPKRNEAVKYFIVANEPRTHRNDDGERGDRKGHEPAFSLLV